MDWKQLLGHMTGPVDEELRLRNAYLAAENRILRNQIKTRRVPLTDAERKTLAEIGQKLGRQALEEIATVAKPDTILGWHRTLVAQTCGSSQPRKALGRPRMDQELEALVVRMARENRSCGYDRIVGALANLGYRISDQTVGNILKRHGIPPVHERKTTMTWKEFIRIHMDVLVATDFFVREVWTWCGLVTAAILFCIHLSSRKVRVAGMTPPLQRRWMLPIARHATIADGDFLAAGRHRMHAGDRLDVPVFQQLIDEAGVKRAPLPLRSADVHADTDRWGRALTREAFSSLLRCRERSLRAIRKAYETPAPAGCRPQGEGHVVRLPGMCHHQSRAGPVRCRQGRNMRWPYDHREVA
jgi:putative transposase